MFLGVVDRVFLMLYISHHKNLRHILDEVVVLWQIFQYLGLQLRLVMKAVPTVVLPACLALIIHIRFRRNATNAFAPAW